MLQLLIAMLLHICYTNQRESILLDEPNGTKRVEPEREDEMRLEETIQMEVESSRSVHMLQLNPVITAPHVILR